MADTYSTMSVIARTGAFLERIYACAAQQGTTDPEQWVMERRWEFAATPMWATKVDSWFAANPGATGEGWATDQAVISDTDILAAVQAQPAGHRN